MKNEREQTRHSFDVVHEIAAFVPQLGEGCVVRHTFVSRFKECCITGASG